MARTRIVKSQSDYEDMIDARNRMGGLERVYKVGLKMGVAGGSSEYLDRLKAVRAELGSLVGGTPKRSVGIIAERVSPSIKRDITGTRVKPKNTSQVIKGTEAEIDQAGKSPKSIAKLATEDYLHGGGAALGEARSTGKRASYLMSEMSRLAGRMVSEAEASGFFPKGTLKSLDKTLGPALRNRERVKYGLPKHPARGTRRSNPVSPSVAKPNQLPEGPIGPTIEPITQKGTAGIPKSFLKGLAVGGLGVAGAAGATVAKAGNMIGNVPSESDMRAYNRVSAYTAAGNNAAARRVLLENFLSSSKYTAEQKAVVAARFGNPTREIRPTRTKPIRRGR